MCSLFSCAGKMHVSLAEALEVRGGPLQEEEVWAVLSQSAESLQELFHKGMHMWKQAFRNVSENWVSMQNILDASSCHSFSYFELPALNLPITHFCKWGNWMKISWCPDPMGYRWHLLFMVLLTLTPLSIEVSFTTSPMVQKQTSNVVSLLENVAVPSFTRISWLCRPYLCRLHCSSSSLNLWNGKEDLLRRISVETGSTTTASQLDWFHSTQSCNSLTSLRPQNML